jgi:amino-acid N-acetyltransferase
MQNQFAICIAEPKNRNGIISLLQEEKLPADDLSVDLLNFFVAKDNGNLIGSIGLEIYDHNGLLRSLVVKASHRKMKVATALVNELEVSARKMGLKNIYLLTETAEGYFTKKGYVTITRREAPTSLEHSTQFSHVCPSSATLMVKRL